MATLDTTSSRSRFQTRKTHVKSGCRTCKIRKVKCDEDRPACRRCISTGRICDGYGIWGGGGNYYGQRKQLAISRSSCVATARPCKSIPVLPSGAQQTGYFEWFKIRTTTKLPGGFVSSFWKTLVLQASLSEPAVLHSVLALSSIHRRGISKVHSGQENISVLDDQMQFSLHHYVKAITHLQPHFSAKDRASFRVALITCIVFVCLDYLRGHFKTAQNHLENGLKVLEERRTLSNVNHGISQWGSCHDSTDVCITEAFSRLHLQTELFKHGTQSTCPVLEAAHPIAQPFVFHSTNEVWQDLERLLNEIFHLNQQGRQESAFEGEYPKHLPALLEDQQRIQAELTQWLAMYSTFAETTVGARSAEEEKHYQLLGAYHTMATIMASTSLQIRNESAFDSHTHQFAWLVRQLQNLRINASATAPIDALPGSTLDMSRSIIDLGWIPPLFYAATKCRVHRVRLQAIRLLESTFHREGIWDSRIAACVAKKVMLVEESDFYRNVDTADDFALLSDPSPEDLLLPTPPESYRIRDVEMVLSDAPMEKIALVCSRNVGGVDRRVLLSEYNLHLQRWINTECRWITGT